MQTLNTFNLEDNRLRGFYFIFLNLFCGCVFVPASHKFSKLEREKKKNLFDCDCIEIGLFRRNSVKLMPEMTLKEKKNENLCLECDYCFGILSH